ncbi:MAG: sugar transferase [Anaerolineaceae bacterium]
MATHQSEALPFTKKTKSTTPGLLRWLDNLLRRLMDLFVAFFGLLILSPFFGYIALRMRKDSPGPLIFRGWRAGFRGRPFQILKFRTMYEDPASYDGSQVTASDDERITPFGKFLRDTKLNELPQLWNVLIGDMALVGPRPEDLQIAALWPQESRDVILSVRPGITSPASITFRSEEKLLKHENVMEEYLRSIQPSKLRLDTLYVRNRTILTDIDVIFWTAVTLLPKLRDRPIVETRLYWGPLSRFFARFLNWFLVDVVVVFSATLVAELIWRTSAPINVGLRNAFLLAFLIGLVFSLINLLLGLNRVNWARAAAGDTISLGASALLSTGILVLLKMALLDPSVMPVGLLITSGLLSFFGFVAVRYRERLITGAASRWINIRTGARTVAERVLIVGAGDNGELAIWLFSRPGMANTFSVCGLLDDDIRKQGQRVNGVDVLGTTDQLQEIVDREDIGLIVYTIYNVDPRRRHKLIAKCHRTGVRVVVIPDIMTQLSEQKHMPPELVNIEENGLTTPALARYLAELEHLSRSGNTDAVHDLVTHLQAILEREAGSD